MPRVQVENVDLLVHPFFKLSQEAGDRLLTEKQREFLNWIVAKWSREIKYAKRRKNNLFVLIEYPLANPECNRALDQLKKFAVKELGRARFKQVSFGLKSPKLVMHVLLSPSFSNVQFLRKKSITINAWGERLGDALLPKPEF